jgi:hypothetical protein
MVSCQFGPGDNIQINVDWQHLSRLTEREMREIIVKCLVFGGSRLRQDITHWLNGGKLDELGHILAGAQEEQSSERG